LCYAITSSCEYPDAAATYLGWILSDKDDFERRKELYINNVYDGSKELYDLSIEWAKDGDYINIISGFGPNLVPYLNQNLKYLDDEVVRREAQAILDTYMNAFLGF